MNHNGWGLWEDRGFLLAPDPHTLHAAAAYLSAETIDELETYGARLPDEVENRRVRTALAALSLHDMAGLRAAPDAHIARAFQLYSFFASAYIHAPDAQPASILPAQLAVPLVQLSEFVSRPPIMAYADYNLANWVRIDAEKPITVENLRLLQQFTHLPDAAWFSLIHVEIEALAAPALLAIFDAQKAIVTHDHAALIAVLATVAAALDAMAATLRRMPEGCHPHTYYHRIRPYLFGFAGVIYEGVAEYEGQPQHFRGETGAQSTVIPALVQFLGVRHERSDLTQHLRIMRDYMPRPHRKLLGRIDADQLRAHIGAYKGQSALQEAYQHTLQRLVAFRKLHLRFAASYIANQSPERRGTGGTAFVDWLQQLIDETETQGIIS